MVFFSIVCGERLLGERKKDQKNKIYATNSRTKMWQKICKISHQKWVSGSIIILYTNIPLYCFPLILFSLYPLKWVKMSPLKLERVNLEWNSIGNFYNFTLFGVYSQGSFDDLWVIHEVSQKRVHYKISLPIDSNFTIFWYSLHQESWTFSL